ncbi:MULTISPECIES: hypothetical protein [Micromonospora]|uniref:hypothetical protein n=1 Tax=Micromonospora TaxID=1873 RepID=UPI0013C50312|nr:MULTISPECIES: hypothetical protein [Micromonospora]MBF5031612.1 hypothetical protein [Micromonospora sp. ANENR4]MCZ7477699.1 hypothetical protein [Micromonospora sp. WMMC273]WBC02424.1 hypothetical protein O7546_25420 [Micromonospora sp. WMMA1976]
MSGMAVAPLRVEIYSLYGDARPAEPASATLRVRRLRERADYEPVGVEETDPSDR